MQQKQQLQFGQGYLLVQRDGNLVLADITGTRQPLSINYVDLVLISNMLCFGDIQQTVEKTLSHPVVTNQQTRISEAQLGERLECYQQMALLRNLPTHPVVPLTSLKPVAIDDRDTLIYLSMHHGISLHQAGFVVWSPLHNDHIVLPTDAVLLMFAFSQGTSIKQAVNRISVFFDNQNSAYEALALLLSCGVLVHKQKLERPLEESLSPFSTDTPATQKVSKNWRDFDADGRIPVYFVPHMENHFPLALGVLFNALRHHNDGELLQKFLLLPINFLEPQDLLAGPYRKFGPGVWLFSNYMWSIDLNMQISESIKQHNGHNFTIHGGPSTPRYAGACQRFLNANQSVDIAVHGEGEVTITDIFDNLDRMGDGKVGFDPYTMRNVAGITYREPLSNTGIRTGARTRMKAPDAIPSPYLSGVFDEYGGRVQAAIIETNRGCPYGCTFCDWGSATNQKIRKFDLERVFDEIEWIGRNQVKVLWIADANYGLYERDIDISKCIVQTKQKYGYPQEVVVNYTKNSTWRLVEIIKVFTTGGIISQGIISIQTSDEKTLEVINRKNIRTERYDELAAVFSEQKLPLSTDLMIGLPGITVDSFKRDLQRYIDMDVSVKAYPTQLLPNSPMADPDYIEKYKIKVDENQFLISTYSYTEAELKWMKALFNVHTMAEGYSLLRYVIRFLQWEHNVPAMTFLETLLKDVHANPDAFPLITWAALYFNQDKSMPGGWRTFYDQIAAYVFHRYHVSRDKPFDVVLLVSEISMPDDARHYPYSLSIEHDFSAYFANAKTHFANLREYGPSVFSVSDPNSLTSIDLDAAQYDSHQYFWELSSPVARPKSLAENEL